MALDHHDMDPSFAEILKNGNLVSKKMYLITGKSLSEALLFAEHGENMLCTKIVLTISVHNMFSPGLSLEFSCIELVIP